MALEPDTQLALIAVFTAVGGPVLLNVLNGRSDTRKQAQLAAQQTAEREQVAELAAEKEQRDNNRQDEVADRAAKLAAAQAEAARKAQDAATAAAAKAAEAARLLAVSDAGRRRDQLVTNTKLDVIHGLVNSQLSAAMQAELDANVRELALMTEIVSLKAKAGDGPTPVAQRAIDLTQSKIEELRVVIADRAAAAGQALAVEAAAASVGVSAARGQDA